MKRFKSGWMVAPLVPVLALVLALSVGCGKKNEETGSTTDTPTAADEPSSAATPADTSTDTSATSGMTAASTTVSLQGAPEDSDFAGTLTITPDGSTGVRIVADVAGVDKDGKHGIHVHENGMCEHHPAADAKPFSTAGGHFNPGGSEHACPPTDPRHAGDLGNIDIAGGKGHLELSVANLSMDQLNGKAIILHAGEDDCKTQPTGNSGDRVACGVVSGPATQ